MKINTSDLVNIVADKAFITKKEAESVLKIVISTIQEQLELGNEVGLNNFGTFSMKEYDSFNSYNPLTKERKVKTNHRLVKFTPTRNYKNSINKDEE